MIKKKIASVEFVNEKLYILPLLTFLDGIVANHKKLDIFRYERFRLVVSEILEKRIVESYPNERGKLYFELFLSDTEFEVSVRDQGVPDWQNFDEALEVDEAERMKKRVLNKLVDSVGMEKLGKDGQRIFAKMRVRNAIDFVEPAPLEDVEVLDENISIRQVKTEEDIIEAIRCIYSEYGYAYGHEALYYVDSFKRKIQNKEILSFLAVNDHGQTAGHFALSFSDTFKDMPEIATVVIRKEFRSLGLFAVFMDHCIQIAKRENCRALMGEPVAFHPMSQKASLRAGFTATSILHSFLDPTMSKAYSQNNERMDMFACVKILDKEATSEIYPPKEITAFVKKIYDNLEWKYVVSEPEGPVEASRVSISDDRLMKNKTILIKEADCSLEFSLKEAIDSAIREKQEMIQLMISLNSSSCEYSYETARKLGFILSGLIPGGKDHDYIIMQMLMGREADYERLVSVGQYEELVADMMELNQ